MQTGAQGQRDRDVREEIMARRKTRTVTLRDETRSRSPFRNRRLLEKWEKERELDAMRRQMERMASKIQ